MELLVSGIKVNLLASFANVVNTIRSSKIYISRFLWKVGVSITVLVMELINYMAKDCGVIFILVFYFLRIRSWQRLYAHCVKARLGDSI